jgi:hypothetical protein
MRHANRRRSAHRIIKLYNEEFDEAIGHDEARIIARNLVTFYLDLEEGGIFQAASELQAEASAESPANE